MHRQLFCRCFQQSQNAEIRVSDDAVTNRLWPYLATDWSHSNKQSLTPVLLICPYVRTQYCTNHSTAQPCADASIQSDWSHNQCRLISHIDVTKQHMDTLFECSDFRPSSNKDTKLVIWCWWWWCRAEPSEVALVYLYKETLTNDHLWLSSQLD